MTPPKQHSDTECVFEADKTKWYGKFNDLEKAIISTANWRDSHEVSAKVRQDQLDNLTSKVEGAVLSITKIEGTNDLIFEKLKTVTKLFLDDKVKCETDKRRNNSFIFTIILCVCGLAVAWGGLKYQVESNTVGVDEMEKHIKIDEARWSIFKIEDYNR